MKNREILFIIRMRNEARRTLRGLNTDLRKTAKAAKSAAAAQNKLNTSVKDTEKKTKDAGKGFKNMGAQMSRVRGTATRLRQAILPLVGALGFIAAIRTIGGFEKQMKAVLAITNATRSEFVALEKEARRLGATTVFSASEAAAGMEFLARAGFDANQIIAGLEDTLNLAIAGNLGLAESADIVSNVMQGFGIEISKTGEAADILAFTAARTNTNIQQLGQAMKFAAPIANSLGVSFNETAAAIGVLGNAGIQASLAGTGLRQTFLRLIDTTPKARRGLKSLGLMFSDVDPRAKSLAEIFQTLDEAGLDAARAIQIFGIRTSGTALILTANAKRLGELAEQTKNVGGFSAETARIMQDNLTDSFKALKSAVEEAILTTGDQGFGGALRATVVAMTEAVRILSGFEGAVEKASTAGRVLATVIKLMGLALAGFVVFKTVTVILKIVGAFQTLRVAIVAARTAQIGLNVAMLANPIGIVIASIAVLVGAVFFLTRRTKGLTASQKELARTTDELAAIRESANASSATGIKKQIELLARQKELLAGEVEITKQRVEALRLSVEASSIASRTIDALLFRKDVKIESSKAEADLKSLQEALAETADALSLLGSSATKGSSDLSRARKEVSDLDKAMIKLGLDVTTFDDTINGMLDSLIKNRAETRENEFQLNRLRLAVQLTNEQLAGFGITQEEIRQAIEAATRAQEAQLTVFQTTIKALDDQIELAGFRTDQRRVEKAVIDAENEALKQNNSLKEGEADIIRERVRLLIRTEKATRKVEDAEKKAAKEAATRIKRRDAFNVQFDKTLAGLRQERQLLGKSAEERERIVAISKLRADAEKAGIKDIQKRVDILNAEFDVLKKAKDEFRADAFGGVTDGLRKFAEEAKNLRGQFEEFTTKTLTRLEDAITQFAETGKFSIRDFVNSAISDLQRIASKQIVGSIAGGLAGIAGGGGEGGGGGGLFGKFNVGGFLGRLFHDGGIVGSGGPKRAVSAAAFVGAQRLHRGGVVGRNATDEVPIIAQRGEVVLTRNQASFLQRALSGRAVGRVGPTTNTQPFGGRDALEAQQNNVTVAMTINTPDVQGFRRSQGQIGAETATAINRALRRNS